MSSMSATLERLFKIAEGGAVQGMRVANFRPACWNAGSCGGLDLNDLWNVDREIARDMTAVFAMIGEVAEPSYPDEFEDRLRTLVQRQRSDLVEEEIEEVSA